MENINHNKTYTVIVLCVGAIIAVWLIQKKPAPVSEKSTGPIVAVQNRAPIDDSNNDWKKLLTTTEVRATPINANAAGEVDPNDFTDTTLTGQMARDLLARYME